MNTHSVWVVLALLLVICRSPVEAANFNKPKAITTVNPFATFVDVEGANPRLCIPRDGRVIALRGYKYPDKDYKSFTTNRERTTMNLIRSMWAVINQNLDPTKRDREKFQQWMTKFVTAINSGYYSKINNSERVDAKYRFADGKSGPDPSYGAKIALLNAAYLVSIVDSLGYWEPGQRQSVIAWGNNLYPQTLKDRRGRPLSKQSKDNVALRAAAYIAWGAVSGTQEPVDYAKKSYISALEPIGNDGAYLHWLKKADTAWKVDQAFREDDKTVGLLVLAAHIAKKTGTDFYSLKNDDGMELKDAIAWLLKAHFSPAETAESELLKDQLRIGAGLDVSHWSWTPIYFNDFPKDELANQLMEKSDIYRPSNGYHHRESMGPVSCLFDRR